MHDKAVTGHEQPLVGSAQFPLRGVVYVPYLSCW